MFQAQTSRIHRLEVPAALQSLGTGPDGLAPREARRRLAEFGANRVETVRAVGNALRFIGEFTHFFALMLWVAAGLALLAEWQDPGKGMAILAAAIVGVVAINGSFSFWQSFRSERAISALQRLLPHSVRALRAGRLLDVPAEELVPGDIILLQQGDSVPADCRLIAGFAVQVNNASITGESLPLLRSFEASREAAAEDARNMLFAGTAVVSGEGTAVVFATGARTTLGRIAHLARTAGETLTPLQKEVVALSRVVGAVAVALGVVFFAVGRSRGLSFWEDFVFATGIIVANVPEGLLPTVTLALAMGARRMARRNVVTRRLPAVEALGSVTVICTDKTGTLTENRMTAREAYADGRLWRLEAAPTPAEAPRHFFAAALACHTVKEVERDGRRTLVGDPTEVALVEMARRGAPGLGPWPVVDEVPFDSDRKRQSVLCREPAGLALYSKGAIEAILPLCGAVRTATGPRPMSPPLRAAILAAHDGMARSGARVVAFAGRAVADDYEQSRLEEDLVFLGLVGLEDRPRAEVPQAVATCKSAGIRVIMITGDHPHTAVAVARQVGLVEGDDPPVVTGDRLRAMSETELQLALDSPDVIFARVGADHKMRIVRALQAKREIVAVTGDGVNDAPALKQADIGIAMGSTGTDVAREAADLILADDNFASIVAAVEEGRAVFANIRKFLTYILTSNVPEIVPFLAFALFDIPLALTIIQILAVDLGTDMLPALALGAERPDPEAMRRPPRRRDERLIDWPLMARAYLFLGVIEAAAAMAAFFFVLQDGGWRSGEALGRADPLYLGATTACLGAIVVMQVINVFLCRSERRSVLAAGFFANRLLFFGIAAELGLLSLIAYTGVGNLLFGTAPLTLEAWLFMLPFALFMLVFEELRKAFVRRTDRGGGASDETRSRRRR